MPKSPHLLKVGVGCNNSLGAKSHSAAGNFQSLKALKIALLPERRSDTLVSKPQTPKHVAAVASSSHRFYLSHVAVCHSMEKKAKLRLSSELGRDGRTVELCKLSTEVYTYIWHLSMLFLGLRCGHRKVVTDLCKKLDESPVCQRPWQWERSWRQRRGAWLFAIIIISTQCTSCQMKTSLFLKAKASDIARCAEPWNNKVVDSTLPLSKCCTVNCCEGKFLESLSQPPILAAAFNSNLMQVAHHQQRQKFVNRANG